VLNTEIQFFSNASLKVGTCMDYTRPSLALGIESIRKSFLDAKGRDVKLRYITEITPENISYCKELMKIADIRMSIPSPNFKRTEGLCSSINSIFMNRIRIANTDCSSS
jgi:hypothetical protein